MPDTLTRATAPNHYRMPEHLAWRPPRRPNAPALYIRRRGGLPPVWLRLIDEYWFDEHRRVYEISINDKCFTVDADAFDLGRRSLGPEVRGLLADVIPSDDDEGSDLGEYLLWGRNVVNRLIAERRLWMIATFLVTSLNGKSLDPYALGREVEGAEGRPPPKKTDEEIAAEDRAWEEFHDELDRREELGDQRGWLARKWGLVLDWFWLRRIEFQLRRAGYRRRDD